MNSPSFHATFAEAHRLHQAGQLADAERLYRQILLADPCHADSLHLLGVIAYQALRYETAVELISRAINLKKRSPIYYCNLGNALKEQGKLDEAVASYDQAIAISPDFAEAHYNRGLVLNEQGKLDDAVANYDRTIAIKPDYAEAHFRRGLVLHEQSELGEAVASYNRCIAIKPDYAEAHSNRGNALKDQGELDEAVASYDRALAIKPDFAEAHYNRGAVLKDQGKHDDAVASYDRALAIKPDFAQAHYNRANALKEQGRLDEAVAGYGRALALKTDIVEPRANPDFWRALTLALMYLPDVSLAERFTRQREFGAKMAERVARPLATAANNRDPERRLRIGWLSSDFRDHPVGRNLMAFFENRDRAGFEAICYAEVKAPDGLTECFRSQSDQWRLTVGLSDAAIAEQIRADGIDVMVYLAGRFDKNRPQVAAWKPAPVQISMLDAGTSGLGAMDYFIADRLMVPAGTVEPFTERVLRLPNFYVHPPISAAPPLSAPPSQTVKYITFGCFNNPAKVNGRVLELWAGILARVPRSRLVLKYLNLYQSEQIRDRVAGVMTRHGIDPARIEMGGMRDPSAVHLGQYGRIDIALDPFPFNGSTTTFEALWMGVPVVALLGKNFMGRWSGSMLHAVGLDELIAGTPNEYIEIAATLAAHPARLALLRAELRQRVAACVLCDGQRTTRYLERGFRAIWRHWCARQNKSY